MKKNTKKNARRLASHTFEQLEPRSMMAAQSLTGVGVTPPVAPPLVAASLDGSGNNLAHPEWGSTAEQLLRRSTAAYSDGASAPSGADRPNARAISNALSASPADGILNDREFSAFVYAWGQFIDHDLSLTEAATPRERFSIAVPTGDPLFDPASTGAMTISLSRSAYDTSTDTATPRQQMNSLTAFIDGSQIYGVDATRAAALREFVGGRLRTSAGNLLPYNTAGLPNANDAHRVSDDKLFLAGDVRANENPELTSLQTLFMREHNRIAASVAGRNPSLSDEQVYQHARRMVIAELQKITYSEFLPAILGERTAASAALNAYRGYRADVNPGITNEFSTAAFRFGHSMLGTDIEFLDNNGNEIHEALSLRDAFFNSPVLAETGIDPILKYLASDRAQEIDTIVVDDVRNFLFGAPGQGGFDLAALNIQRGREHGIADYNSVRAAYGLAKITSFAEITDNKAVQDSLAATYGSVDKLDLWVAGLAEKHLPGSSMGATFTRILVDQFSRLRDGDRYWYQNALPADAVRDIQKTTLADIVRRNTTLTNLQPNVFFFKASIVGNLFVDANRDGTRQRLEGGVAGLNVSLVNAVGATIATTVSDSRGNYMFKGLDLGSYKVIVTPQNGGTAITSRVLTITRGGDLSNDVALAPRPQAPPAPKPATKPTAPPTNRPAPAPLQAGMPSTAARASMFAAMGSSTRTPSNGR